MDLEIFEPTKESVFLQLKNPLNDSPLFLKKTIQDEAGEREVDDEDQPIGVYIVGADSEVYKKRRRQIVDRRLEVAQKKKQVKLSAAEIEDETKQTLVACVTGVKNIKYKGETLEFSHANVFKLITALPWIEEQIDEAIVDRAHFMKALPANF